MLAVPPRAAGAFFDDAALVLWDAVEKAKEAPSKLEGPGGVFTSRPKQ